MPRYRQVGRGGKKPVFTRILRFSQQIMAGAIPASRVWKIDQHEQIKPGNQTGNSQSIRFLGD